MAARVFVAAVYGKPVIKVGLTGLVTFWTVMGAVGAVPFDSIPGRLAFHQLRAQLVTNHASLIMDMARVLWEVFEQEFVREAGDLGGRHWYGCHG